MDKICCSNTEHRTCAQLGQFFCSWVTVPIHIKQSGFEPKSWAFQQCTPGISECTEFWGEKLTPPNTCENNVSLTGKCGVLAGDYRVFRDDVVFWVTFTCVALMIPVLFVGCPRIVSNCAVTSEGGREKGGVRFLMKKVVPWNMYRKLSTALWSSAQGQLQTVPVQPQLCWMDQKQRNDL